jgi:hypothetical protein
MLMMSGCGLFNLNGWVVSDDLEFLEVVESLKTPEMICNYMKNFNYKEHPFYAPDPYTFWKLGEGDCNDFETFARFVADYHGYTTYRVVVYIKGVFFRHALAVFEEDGFTYQDIKAYKPIYADTFKEVVEHWEKSQMGYEVRKYKVYDYEGNEVD